MVYFCFLIPLLAAIILVAFFRRNIVWWELTVPIISSVIFILIAKLICINSLTYDVEYLGGYVKEVRYFQDWNEYIHRTCSRPCGKSTCFYDCSYVSYHPEYWTAETTLGRFNISREEYNRLLRQFKVDAVFKDLHRDYYTNDGDMYYGAWRGEDQTLESVVIPNGYENRPKACVNVYHFDKPDTSEIKQYGLYEYPAIYNLYKQRVILGYNDSYAEKKLEILNSRFGSTKQIHVFILVFKNKPREAAIMQENYWEGGNKNEFVICIGVDSNNVIKWGYDFSWTDREDSKVDIRTHIEDQIGNTLNLSEIIDFTNVEIKKNYERKNFHDFDYLTIEPTMKQTVWIFILTVLVNVGVCWWAVTNDFDNEEETKKHHKHKFKKYLHKWK